MGLLKAGAGALGGVLADQWRDYFYCDALEAGVLAAKAKSVLPGALAIPRGMKISFPTAPFWL